MKTPTGNNRNPYDILHIVFASFYLPNYSVSEGITVEMKLHRSFASYIEIQVENLHLLIYVNYKTYTKAMLCKFLS